MSASPAAHGAAAAAHRRELVARKAAAAGAAAAVSALGATVCARLAMALLAHLNPEEAGVRSDDNFVIGRFTFSGTIQLTASVFQLILLGATVYMLVRPFLIGTGATRVVTSTIGFGVPAAALLIHPGGVDFTRLEPFWLGIALFVALPMLGVAFFAALVERWLRDRSWFLTAPRAHVLPLLALWLPAGIAAVLPLLVFLGALAYATSHSDLDPDRRPLTGRARLTGQGVLVGIAALGAWGLADDVAAIL